MSTAKTPAPQRAGNAKAKRLEAATKTALVERLTRLRREDPVAFRASMVTISRMTG